MTDAFYESAQAGYRQKRYLEHATQAEMTERLNDICANLYVFDRDGIAVVPKTPRAMHFLGLLAHFFEEMRLRNGSEYSFHVPDFHLDDARYPNAKRADQLWKQYGSSEPGSHILKFGKAQYLEPLLSEGKLRVSPASFYSDDSLTAAIRDDELRVSQVVTGGIAKFTDTEGVARTFPIHGPAKISHVAGSDFYLSCYAVAFENRLFDDFDADACLVIKDVDRYCALLSDALRPHLRDWTFSLAGVEYRDPYAPIWNPNVFVTKHLRYSYQLELRALWVPPEPIYDLKPLDVALGVLSDFCELLRL